MAVKLGLWSLTLVPGEKYPLYVKNDFQITNAALSDELRSTDGRSVLKVTHVPVNPAMYDDSDSEIDSDDEDMLGDDDLPEEDEFELDVEEGFKEVEKKSKKNGDASMDAEDDDEEEEDEEDDDDFSDVEEEVTNVICALTAGKIEQATINLTFTAGDAVMFEITGENAVHLMGNYIAQPNPFDSDSDDEDHEHDDYDEMYDDESDDEETAAFIEELKEAKEAKKSAKPAAIESKPVKAAAPKAAATPAAASGDKKRKAEAIDSPASKTPAAASADNENLSKAQKKKLAKKAKTEDAPAAASAAPAQASTKAVGGVKKTLPSGLVIEDIKKGDGPVAKGGKRLSMRYIGKLTDGKQFDANTAGKPFSFVLGRGEVIKGWDEGLMGMNVGGERRLTIPAALAYGSQKIPGIPKNSTLKFDVKLLAVN